MEKPVYLRNDKFQGKLFYRLNDGVLQKFGAFLNIRLSCETKERVEWKKLRNNTFKLKTYEEPEMLELHSVRTFESNNKIERAPPRKLNNNKSF